MKFKSISVIKLTIATVFMLLIFNIAIGLTYYFFGRENYEILNDKFPSFINEIEIVENMRPCTNQARRACIITKSGLKLELEGNYKRPIIVALNDKTVRCQFKQKTTLKILLEDLEKLEKFCERIGD